MKILVTGGTGLVGRALIEPLVHAGHQLIVWTRDVGRAATILQNVELTSDLTVIDFNQLDAVINLAGEPIANRRWSTEQKERICQSRWLLTEAIVSQILAAQTPPKLLLNASAVGFYGRQDHGPLDENYPGFYPEFSHDICARWENLAKRAESVHTRVAIVRIGIVLSNQGGALGKMLPAFKAGFGGPLGSGQQYMSWIHIDDLVGLCIHLLHTEDAAGIYHGTAPMAVTNEQFSKLLAERLHRSARLRTPGFVLRLLFGEMADLLLFGQQVYPQRVLDSGYRYRYSQLRDALAALDL